MPNKRIKRIVSLGFNYYRNRDFDGQFLADNKIDIARLNFSHLDLETADDTLEHFRIRFPKMKLLQDLQGQKWRVSRDFKYHEFLVNAGDKVYFCSEKNYSVLDKNDPSKILIPIHMEGSFAILADAKKISMKDGSMEFDILENKAKTKEYIIAQAKDKIMLRREKSINIPGVARLKLKALTKRDKEDLEWGIKNEINIVCLSFVNKKKDIEDLKKFIKDRLDKKQKMPVIWAKIETKDGYNNFKDILNEVDGIMLGRGDLLPELGRFESSLAQYDMLDIFSKKNSKKDFIIATHVLDSMMQRFNEFPSISNLNDIYQSVLHGATGFMLSNEVGYGKQPKKTIKIFNDYLSFLEKKLGLKN